MNWILLALRALLLSTWVVAIVMPMLALALVRVLVQVPTLVQVLILVPILAPMLLLVLVLELRLMEKILHHLT
jgi:hypothetical protein